MSTKPKTEDFFIPEDTDEEVDFGRIDIKPDLEKQIKGLEVGVELGRPRGLKWLLENRNSLDPGHEHTIDFTKVTLDSTPDVDHDYSGLSIQLTANENQAIGDVCYINSSGK